MGVFDAIARAGTQGGARKGAFEALDLSLAARQARARAAGFDVKKPWFHGTERPFEAFDLDFAGRAAGGEDAIFLAPTGKEASRYAHRAAVEGMKRGAAVPGAPSGQLVLPLHARPGLQWIEDINGEYNPRFFQHIVRKKRAEGYDSVLFKGAREQGYHEDLAPPLDQLAMFKPRDLRSIFAKFDPARTEDSDLLAMLAGGVMGGVMGGAGPSNYVMFGDEDINIRALRALLLASAGGAGAGGAFAALSQTGRGNHAQT